MQAPISLSLPTDCSVFHARPVPGRRSGWAAVAAAVSLLLGAPCLQAQNGFPPDLMSYQGYLVDANGNALAPNNPVNYAVVFRIYTQATGGTSIWTENQTVTMDKGNFSVVLGEGGAEGSEPRPLLSTLFNSDKSSDLYLGITVKGVSGAAELAPRMRLLTSPYAFLARTANGLAGSDGGALIASDAGRLRISQSLQTTGGNARGTGAVDLQTVRSSTSPGQVASGVSSVIAGGQFNAATQGGAAILGGNLNAASGWWSAIGGGEGNAASGNFSAVPGGQYNTAQGHYSLAAGRRAKALHSGSFVFGDNRDSDKSTTGDNQFLVYANGGMSINTTPSSGSALTVSGKVKADTAEVANMTVTSTLAAGTVSGFGTVPVGGIILWSGAANAVPAGWAICNGGTVNGKVTPDLRDRFVVGAGGSYGVGATGGANFVQLTEGQMPSHNHSVIGNTSTAGNHSHPYDDIYFSEAGGPWGNTRWKGSGDSDNDNGPWFTRRDTFAAGDHSHSINLTSGSKGNNEAHENRPPYYALCYIMRVQ